MEQPDALQTVLEPMKQWLFAQDADTPIGQIASAFAHGMETARPIEAWSDGMTYLCKHTRDWPPPA